MNPAFWNSLKPPAKEQCGELLTSLSYYPNNSVLILKLLMARDLQTKNIEGKSDIYVKVWLQYAEKRIAKRKTQIFKNTCNPVINERFRFIVPFKRIWKCSLDVMVMNFDHIEPNELIGRILIAGKSGPGATETEHWEDMIAKPHQTIKKWHRLTLE